MKHDLEMDKIAEGIGGQRKGKVKTTGGYFGAMQLAAEVARRFRVPTGGGRATDPRWVERRLVPFTPETLERLDQIAEILHVERLQAAGLILERILDQIQEEDLADLIGDQ